MKPNVPVSWLISVAGLSLLVGSIWTVTTLTRLPGQRRHLQRKAADLHTIVGYQRTLEEHRDAVRMFEALPDKRPTPLVSLVREQIPDAAKEVRRRDARPAADNWQAQRWEVDLDNIPLNQLGVLLAGLESERPPWRLIEASIRAADRDADRARVTLLLEGLTQD